MNISPINNSYLSRSSSLQGNFKAKKTENDLYTGMNGERLVLKGDASKYFEVVKNVSNNKVGSKFILESKVEGYRGLRILITPESSIKSDKMQIGIEKSADNTSFKGKLYGSIRENDGSIDFKMQDEYVRFWSDGMHNLVTNKYQDRKYAPHLKDDYNFYIPSDGDGTRYKDITALQGGVTKPASDIPATLNDKQMSLVQGIITNFARTGKLDDKFGFIRVKPAQGSAYGFLEGLKKGDISTDKPLVFSWGDNFSDINISRLMKNHEDSHSGFSITVLPVDKSKTKALSIVKTSDVQGRKIDKFVEKPQDEKFIDSCVLPQFGKDKCLSAVGPYILSPQALTWIKENYTDHPQTFLNPDKGYDFSSMVIAPMLEAFNNGEILDEDGNPMEMKFDLIDKTETWSDLGSQKDFSQAIKGVRKNQYLYLPREMKTSLRKNIDANDNITFNFNSNRLLHSLFAKLDVEAKNVIGYYKDALQPY